MQIKHIRVLSEIAGIPKSQLSHPLANRTEFVRMNFSYFFLQCRGGGVWPPWRPLWHFTYHFVANGGRGHNDLTQQYNWHDSFLAMPAVVFTQPKSFSLYPTVNREFATF